VRNLRRGGEFGLLYGNGGHCTHNHAIALARHLVAGVSFPQDYHFQELADAQRGPIPPLTDDYEGPAVIETYTVFYDREGLPKYGVVLARNPVGARVISRIDAADERGIAFLTDGGVEPVGTSGHTVRRGDTLYWQISGISVRL